MAYLTIKHKRVTKQAVDETIRMLFEPTPEPEPITATKAKASNNAPTKRKKPVKQPVKPSSDTKKGQQDKAKALVG